MDKKEISTIDELLDAVSTYITDSDEINIIKKAYSYASKIHKGQKRLSGEDYILHPLNVAYILTSLDADSDTIATALLHDVIHKGNAELDDIKEKFGEEIAELVDGITTINKISLSAENESIINYHKKILVGLTEDVRIIIIKIAERVHNMRTLWAIPKEKQAEKAKETLEILAPIAHRLGLSYLKGELEELSLKYYKPDAYKSVEEMLDSTKEEREKSVNEMIKSVSDELINNDISFEIKGRAKSIYSIYNKLQKGKKFSDIYDIYALRIIVDTISECYQVLGLIHAKYKPIPKRFKDYIANPKNNMYQSLHTTVFGYGGKPYEIQIRTYEMDRVAEKGIASHWSYKEQGKKIQGKVERKLQLFRNIIELNDEKMSAEDFVNSVKDDVLGDNIYVYTPTGDVFELPVGSTPIDFAYRIHTKIGETMVGALVNDNIVSLDTKLKTGDIVRIKTNKNSSPSKEWINIARTSSAKNKIKAFFSKMDKEEAIEKGKELLSRELRKKKLPNNYIVDNLNVVLEGLKIDNEEEMYLSIGTGKFSSNTVINTVKNDKEDKEEYLLSKIERRVDVSNDAKNDILVGGVDEVKVTIAKCCRPIKGDNIIGYISRGNGIIVHNQKCKNLRNMSDRLIDVSWNENTTNKFKTKIRVFTNKKDNILVDIITKASSFNINIIKINTIYEEDKLIFDITVNVEDVDKLNKYMNNLISHSDILNVVRKYN